MTSTAVNGGTAYLGVGVGIRVGVPGGIGSSNLHVSSGGGGGGSSSAAEDEGSPTLLDEPLGTVNGSPSNEYSAGEEDETGSGDSQARMSSFSDSRSGGTPEKRASVDSVCCPERAKKRRKQSNPVRIAASRFCDHETEVLDYSDLPLEEGACSGSAGSPGADCATQIAAESPDGFCCDKDGSLDAVYTCPHCDALCHDEDLLRRHIELEHVQRALEQQLQQQQGQKFMAGGSGSSFFAVSKDFHHGSLPEGASLDSSSSSPPEMKLDIGKLTPNSIGAHLMQHQGVVSLPPPPPPPPLPPPPPPSSSSHLLPPPLPPSSLPQLQDPKDVASLMALSAFGSPPFFLPLMSCGAPNPSCPPPSSLSQNVPTSSSSNNTASSVNTSSSAPPIRIFNPEAYCELCNKEFCNKYFLKTHKANKHGIYLSEGISGSTSSSTSSSLPFPPVPTSLHVPLPPTPTISVTGEILTPPKSGPSAILNLEAFCDLCQKEFCNKYFLRKHRQKIHGIMEFIPISSCKPMPTSGAVTFYNAPPTMVSTAVTCAITGSSSAPTATVPVIMSTGHCSNLTPELGFINDLSYKAALCAANSMNSNAAPMTTATTMASCDLKPFGLPVNSNGGGPNSHGSLDQKVNGTFFTPERLREMGVINVEAFCEICCKEFCNKYFLRTHKQNKHGIPMPELSGPAPKQSPGTVMQMGPLSLVVDKDMPSSSTVSNLTDDNRKSTTPSSSSSSSMSVASNGVGHTNNNNNNNNNDANANTEVCADLTCEVCSRPFASYYLLKMHKFYFHNIGETNEKEVRPVATSSSSRPQEDDAAAAAAATSPHDQRPMSAGGGGGTPGAVDHTKLNEESTDRTPLSEDLQKLQTMIRELNAVPKDTVIKCGVCQKEMKNKYFLRAHMINEHGELHNESDLDGGDGEVGVFGVERSPPMAILTANAISSAAYSAMLTSSVTDPESFCDLCKKEFCSRYFLRLHKLNAHGIVERIPGPPTMESVIVSAPSQIPPPPPPPPPLPLPPPVTAALEKSKLEGIAQGPSADRTPGVTGRNFCEICNKELCNKYFMKTHMLKMHGISVDERVAGGGSVPGATIGGVTCDICQKELCSKYFLKVHKQNTHGVVDESMCGKDGGVDGKDFVDGDGSGGRYFSHYTEVCPICERRFKSIKWLKTHMVNDHADLMKDPTAAAAAASATSSLETYSGNFCVICHMAFGDAVALHVHLIKDHPSLTDTGAVFTSGSLPPPPPPPPLPPPPSLSLPSSQPLPSQPPPPHTTNSSLSLATSQPDLTTTTTTNSSCSDAAQRKPHDHRPQLPSPAMDSLAAAGLGYSLQPPARTTSGLLSLPPVRRVTSSHGARVYHCSYCAYATRWLSNLYAHEKRHTGLVVEGEKRFSCRVCHRAYRYNHSLQRHLLSHKGGACAGIPCGTVGNIHRAATVQSSGYGVSGNHSGTPRMYPSSRPSSQNQGNNNNNAAGAPLIPMNSSYVSTSTGLCPKPLLPSRVKKYRCSKCGAKYRSREQCLNHIQAAHNTRVRTSSTTTAAASLNNNNNNAGSLRNGTRVMIPDTADPKLDDDDDDEHDDDDDDDGDVNHVTSSPTAAPLGLNPSGKTTVPMTYGMPQTPPPAGSFIMQPFLMTQPETTGAEGKKDSTFVPSLVYLPVSHKVVEPLTIAVTLTPA